MNKIKYYWKHNKIMVVIFVIILICLVFLGFKNYKDDTFLTANIIDIFTMAIGVIITFFITERMTDKRRRNDCIEHVILEIEEFVSNDDNFKINKSTLLKQASCANRIKYLKDASFNDISEDITFIEQHYEEIRGLYSNHSSSEEELNGIKIDIDKHRNLVVDKCIKIRIGLYS